MLRKEHDQTMGTKDSSLLARNLRQGVAEEFLMIEVNISNHRDAGIGDVSSIQPASHTYLEHRQLYTGAGEILEHHCGEHFKKTRVPGQFSAGHELFRDAFDPVIHFREFNVADGLAIDLNALIDLKQMRRGIESSAVPCS